MSRIDADTRVHKPEHVAHNRMGEESVLLNLRTGEYHGLNPTATTMFERLLEHGRPGPAAAAVAEDFEASPDEVLSDVLELCAGLVDRGLIETVDPPA